MISKCPDILTIQAFLDGEITDTRLSDHLRSCPHCRVAVMELEEAIFCATALRSEAALPAGFYDRLVEKTASRPFPALLMAVLAFTLAFFSAYTLEPGFIQWWLSVGLTRQFGLLFDALIDLLYLGHLVGPAGIIIGLSLLVGLEVVLLNFLRSAEGQKNG